MVKGKGKSKRKKNRLLTDALREVRHTRSRFLSILVLSALAVAFLSGLRTTAPDMEYTADNYYDAVHLMDGYVLSTLGIVEEDLDALSAAPGIQAVEGGYTLDAVAEDSIVIVRSLPEEINLLTVEEGRLPERSDECVTEELLLLDLGLEIGDTLSIVPGEDNADALERREYTIVGTVSSPLYVSTDRGTSSLGTGSVSAYVYIPAENFTWDYYTVAFFTGEGLAELDGYSDAYDDQAEALVDSLDGLAEERAQLRQDNLVGEAQAEIDDAQAELDDAKVELEDARAEAEQELEDAQAELDDARRELDDGWSEYYDGVQELEDSVAEAEQEIADGQKELDDALVELNDGEAELADARVELDDGWDDYYDGLAQYEDAEAEFDEGYQDYLDGVEAYEDGLAEYESGRRQLNRALTQLNDGEAEYSTGKAQFDQLTDQLWTAAQTSGMTGGYASMDALLSAAAAGDSNASTVLTNILTGIRTTLNATISELQTQLNDLSKELDAANQAVAMLPEQIEALETQIAEAEKEGSGVSEEDLEKLRAQKSELEAQLKNAQESIPTLTAGISQIQANLTPLQTQAAQMAQISAATVIANYNDLVSARRKLDDGWDEYYDGSAQLRAARRQLDDAEEELDAAREEIEAGQAELDEAKAELDDAYEQLLDGEADYADGRAELDEGWQDYNDGLQELEDARATLAQETADAQAELDDAYRELQDGEADYAQGVQDYEDGKAEAEQKISDAENEIGEAEDKLAEAQWELDDLDDCEWYVLGRDTNVGVVGYSQDAERVSNLADIFPIIFFLVAALACLTTMTRMVEEQRTQIGSLKALGFGRLAISIKYIGYAFSASLLGGIAGLLIGCTLIPLVIANAFRIMYNIPSLQFLPQPGICILAVAAAVLCTTGAAVWACASTLMATPANLMRPRAPKAGKRVFLEYIRPLWRHLSFTWKVTMRNLFRYQRRFWMTVIGIGGCTALIVTGFGLHNSIFDILDKQFDEVFLYDATVGLEDHLTDRQWNIVTSYLDGSEAVEQWLPSYQESVDASTDSRTVEAVTLFAVSDQEEFSRFVDLRHRLDDAPVALEDGGVVLSEKLAELLGVGVGDSITLDGDSRVTAPVTDIVENYVQHYVYLTEDYYTQLFQEDISDNVLLLSYADNNSEISDQVSTALMAMNGVASYSYIATVRDTFTESMNSVDYAVMIIIVAVAALAFVVLYNLTNINITERTRELATLKVLGFYDGETSAYVYRENIFLTLFGILLGLFLGRLLHSWLVLTVEVDMVMFGRTAPPYAYILAAVLTVIFSLAVNVAAHFKLKKVDMVESLKTVE